MNRKTLTLALFLISINVFAQNNVTIKLVTETREPLPNANIFVSSLKKNFTTDSLGYVFIDKLPLGENKLVISYAGMEEKMITIGIPFKENVLEVIMTAAEEEEEIVIQSTRSTRTIQDIPTRVEFVAGEELDEKANMKPGDIRMVLNESTGIQTQQTSATSANASIRIQGLDGRYTQVLKDGFPLYAGFSSGLGLLQTPPLDLKQFEVIKGSASTLYGGGAISGLVNLISKTPGEERELKFHFDVTSAGGLNTSGFYGKKFAKAGITLFASRNSNAPYDPAGIGLTAIPKFERYTVNPRLFLYFNENTEIDFGLNVTTENRTGGDVSFIKGNNPSGFFEANASDRYSTQFIFKHKSGNASVLTVKNSWNNFKRVVSLPAYVFNGIQNGTFTEISVSHTNLRMEWVSGINLVTDNFREQQLTTTPLRNYAQMTVGVFVQNSWKINEHIRLESGLRGDGVKDFGFALLPRISALFKISQKFSSRIGGGLGYKTPNIFTEESEKIHYRDVLPIDKDREKLERSAGVSADINYKTKFGDSGVSFSINQLFFYTRIGDPLLLRPEGNNFRFHSVQGYLDSKGAETNVKLGYDHFKLFLGYTFVKAHLHEGTFTSNSLLTPMHRLNSVLMFEVEEKWKAGLEAYYFSQQELSDGTAGKSYWITGFMAERLWKKFSLYVNFENFTDIRQTKFENIYTGSIVNPVFRDIYAPLDGFVINGGIKLNL